MFNYNDGELDPEYVRRMEEYQRDLRVKTNELEVSAFRSGLLNILCHPIRLVRTHKEIKRMYDVSYGYYKILNTDLWEFVTEETGDVNIDLQNARLKVRPAVVREYMKNNPVYIEEIDKKLLKTRK